MLILDSCGRSFLGQGNSESSWQCACIFDKNEDCDNEHASSVGRFSHFFSSSDSLLVEDDIAPSLVALAEALAENPPPKSRIGAISEDFGFVGRFLFNDIVATSAGSQDDRSKEKGGAASATHTRITEKIVNLRTGRMDLDALYGGAAIQGAGAHRLRALIRNPTRPARLLLGRRAKSFPHLVPSPTDRFERNQTDLPRLGGLGEGAITQAKLEKLPAKVRARFIFENGELNPAQIILGDTRNSDNAGVSQIHLSLALFHNLAVEHAASIGGPPEEESRDAFDFARRQTRWHYQWLILHDYLARICREPVFSDTLHQRAPAYTAFINRVGIGRNASRLPLPFESITAVLGFGIMNVLASNTSQDDNGSNRTSETGPPYPILTFRQPNSWNASLSAKLPAFIWRWAADWAEPLENQGPKNQKRSPKSAEPSRRNVNAAHVREHALRALQEGQRLNLPTGQAAVLGMAELGIIVPLLSREDLAEGAGGTVLQAANLLSATPLWYYILRESEVQTDGETLGTLGSRLLAETLIGLIVHDPHSYWNAPGSDQGRWCPDDGIQPKGRPIMKFADLMDAVDLLA